MYVKGTPDIEITYKYNEEGIRVEKSIKDLSSSLITTTTYKVQGSKVIEEATGSNNIHYYYDINNSLIGFKHNNKNYYYEKSVLNDIIGIVNDEGSTVVKYTYDAYGNITNIIDTSGINLSTINSYKYKDYYYDTESSYYYLNSRYYNPEVRRFINADDVDILDIDQGTVLEHNLYAYTLNNPINMVDDDGYIAWWAAAAISGAVFDTVLYVAGQVATGQKITLTGVGKSALSGAISGVALGGIGKGIKSLTKAFKVTKTGTKVYSLGTKAINKAVSDTRRLQHAFKHAGKFGFGNWNKATAKQWENFIRENLENYTKKYTTKLGEDSVIGYYRYFNGQNIATYIYKSGPYKGLVATVVELTENQMTKFKLW